MWAYLSHGLERQGAHALEEHLEVCQRCCGELEFSRQLRAMIAQAGTKPMPPAVRTRLEELIGDPSARAEPS